MADFPGLDWSTFVNGIPDLDPTFGEITGPRVVLEQIARRLISPAGSHHEQEYGFDLTQVQCASLTNSDLSSIEANVAAQARRVDGVEGVRVRVILDGTFQLTVQIEADLSDDETYTMVFILSANTLQRIVIL